MLATAMLPATRSRFNLAFTVRGVERADDPAELPCGVEGDHELRAVRRQEAQPIPGLKPDRAGLYLRRTCGSSCASSTRDRISLEPAEVAPSKICWTNAQLFLRFR